MEKIIKVACDNQFDMEKEKKGDNYYETERVFGSQL